ncbi:MAG: hypothetical protein HY880_08410 [Deltaproteobacteria bacterium]|nr:hypothetical protein [Deltaproteobacteria bacterium]
MIVISAAVSTYVVTIFNGFADDDILQILENPWIKDIRYIKEIFFSSVWAFAKTGEASNYYRPLMHLVYMAEYHVFGSTSWTWHLVNISLHAINALMVLLVAMTLVNKTSTLSKDTSIPLFAGLVFAVHPINTEAVAWIACIPELAYTMLVLTALYLRLNNIGLWPLAGLFLAALLFKETAVILLPLIVICDHVVSKPTWKKRIAMYLPLMIVLAVYLILRIYALGSAAPKERMHPYLNDFQYILNIFPLFFDYMKALVLPLNLSSFHVLKPVYSLTEPRFLVSISALAAIFFACLGLVKREPLYAVPLAIVLLPLIPVLYIPLLSRNTFAERYLYMPCIGFSILAGFFFNRLLLRVEKNKILMWTSIFAFTAVILLYWSATVKRASEWRDDLTLWSATIKKQPDNYFLLKKLAGLFRQKGMKQEALSMMARSIEANLKLRDPDPRVLVMSFMELGDIYAETGDYMKALIEYDKVARVAPLRADIHLKIGRTYTRMGQADEALASYREALKYAETLDEKKDIEDHINVLKAAQGR